MFDLDADNVYSNFAHDTTSAKTFAYQPIWMIEADHATIPLTTGYSVYADGVDIQGV